ISLVRGQPGDRLEPAIEQARREKRALGHDWRAAVLDDQLLPERLVVRPRLRGERARVLGHKRTKKLKNLMIDHRIPTSRRAIWPIVATPDGQYVWSPGLPPADEFAARDETHGLAILRASGVRFRPGRTQKSHTHGAVMEKTLRIVRSEEEIRDRIQSLAAEIREKSTTGDLTIVGILDDTFVFLADLIRTLDTPLSCCFMKVSSHRHGGQTEVMFTSEF